MALAAVWQGATVHVVLLVAGVTLLAHTSQLSAVFVAFRAGKGVVHPSEREVFVEIPSDLPALFYMTFLAT